MGETAGRSGGTGEWMRWTGGILALLWGILPIYSNLAHAIMLRLGIRAIVLRTLFPGVIFLAVAIVAWVRPRVGAWLLIACAVILAVLYGFRTHGNVQTAAIAIAVGALPPALAGVLFLLSARRSGD